MKRKTTDQFIKESNITHNNKYDYSLVEYTGNKNKVKIICPIHGKFEQIPQDHINGHGCSLCSNNKKNTTGDFIIKCKNIYNKYDYDYDYSLVEYINNKTNVKIICKKHGIFNIRPDNFLQMKTICPKCNTKINNLEKFIEYSNIVHKNLYDYSLTNYINTELKVKIICKEHGIFEQSPHNHLNGKKCPYCCKNVRLTTHQFINKSIEMHGDTYDYSLVEYKNTNTKVKIICKKHGFFEQYPYIHLNNSGCPLCKESIGEKKIRLFLEKNNINYITQKKFLDCRNKLPLPFDFYLPNYNICIEFDGIQHFKIKDFFGGIESLNTLQNNDNIKTEYCKNNKIELIRISFNEIKDVDKILTKKFFI